ncbi:MAG: sulfide-dependent adenosine diphosphate thiazole synthase [Kiritimatiellae bacterium]|nr:sulfide-dependent adenosine diphosphate thiazole synthase [Kiritimatiellia bacterium]
MEPSITRAIVRSYLAKLDRAAELDVALVGAGPSALMAARDLAAAGRSVAIFERRLAPGGGVWGGGMLFNEVVLQEDLGPLLDELGVGHAPAGEGLLTADSVELAAALILGARRAGALIFNAVTVEDLVVRVDRVAGLVINWAPVVRQQMHVDPICVVARAVVDATGHPGEIVRLAALKGGLVLDTPTRGVPGERPMWAEMGEAAVVQYTGRVCAGLYVCGMAANQVGGGHRMGPIFGGMLRSGRKVAEVILRDLANA